MFSQMGVTSYSIYSLGINTSQNKKISAELKTFANRKLENILMELDVFYNFQPRSHHRFSLGVGINAIPFGNSDLVNAFTIPASIEIYPFKDFHNLSLLFELAPEFYPENSAHLRSLWGIRYTFGE
jgi:hypothetical protein